MHPVPSGSESWFRSTFAALRLPEFRILWSGTVLAHMAFFMSTVVQSVVAFELVGSNTAVGSVVFAQGLATTLLGPLGGALADRWPKRLVLAVSQTVPACVFLGLAHAYAAGFIAIEFVAGGSFLIGVSFAFLGPARQAMVVDLVSAEGRGNAIALAQVASTSSQVMGPGAAGLLLMWDASGPAGAYAVMGGLYVVSTALLLRLPRTRMRADASRTHVLADVLAGFRYVLVRPRLRALVMLYVGVIMVGFPYVTVMPGLVENALGRDAEAYAFLSFLSAAGALTASVAVARYADHERATSLFAGMGIVFGAALAVLAIAADYAIAAVAMVPIGIGFGGFMTLNGAVIVRSTDPVFFGRVMSLTMLAFGWFGLMGLPIGLLADAVGERGALAAMGAAVVCIVGGIGWVLSRSSAGPGTTRASP